MTDENRRTEVAPRVCPQCGKEWTATIRGIERQRGLRIYPCAECREAKRRGGQPIRRPYGLPVIKPGEWVHQGECDQSDPEVWWDDRQVQKAIEICQGCPVITECLNWALANNETEGVWGGTMPRARAGLIKARLKRTGS